MKDCSCFWAMAGERLRAFLYEIRPKAVEAVSLITVLIIVES